MTRELITADGFYYRRSPGADWHFVTDENTDTAICGASVSGSGEIFVASDTGTGRPAATDICADCGAKIAHVAG